MKENNNQGTFDQIGLNGLQKMLQPRKLQEKREKSIEACNVMKYLSKIGILQSNVAIELHPAN